MSSSERTTVPRIAAWLENFQPDRREVAALLVNGLTLVSETDLRRELDRLVSDLVDSLPNPIAVFPSREVAKTASAHSEGKDGSYQMFEPGFPGSEGVVANIVAALQRRPSVKGRILGHPDLSTLRENKARTILLIDDFSGSGKRLLDFERALRRHKTIRSWASSRFVTFHVAVYAATEQALKRLRRRFGEERVHIARPCPTFDTMNWTIEQRADVESFCIDYARKNKPMALGFKKSRAMIAFEHTAPNNLPFVLWRIGDSWKPLFEQKYVPTDLLGLFRMIPAPALDAQAGSTGAERVGKVLDRLAHRIRDEDRIAADLDLSIKEVRRLLTLVLDLGLANAGLRLTDQGLVALRRWRAEHPVRELPDNDAPYYPQQLRAGR